MIKLQFMNRRLLYIVAVAALGGFLFGFDSGVISGCEKAIQSEFGLSALWHGLIISGAMIGTVIGVFTAGRPSDCWGRKPTLWLMAMLFLVSAVGCAFTPFEADWGPHLLGWFRFIGGLAIGGVSVVVPLYIVADFQTSVTRTTGVPPVDLPELASCPLSQ